jgi:chromatin remodeling complex protein RSC6
MSKNISNTNSATTAATATAATASSSAKRVSKKSDAAAPVATPAVAAVAATPVASASSSAAASAPAKKATKQVAPAQEAASAPAPAPVASVEVVAEAVEVRSVDQEINDLVKLHQNLRDQAVAAIKTLQKVQKRVAKEIKEAGRRRRRVKKEDDGQVKEKRPTIFTTPVTLKDELSAFLGKPKGHQMTPADVTRAFSAYVELHKLKDAEKGHTIHPDTAMRKVLGVKDGEVVTYRNVQSYLYKLYVLPEKKSATKQ